MTIEWATRAIRDMRRLPTRERERIVAKIEQYARDPASLVRHPIHFAAIGAYGHR